ncbi:MAG: hypothetical protein ACR2N7_06125 [Acidimicrobiia bacterium]
MNSLDTIARTSAQAVHESVAEVPVPIGAAGAAASAAASFRVAGYALAGAAAGVAVVAALIVSAPTEDAATPPSTVAVSTTVVSVTSTVPTPSEVPVAPVAPIPDSPSQASPPATTPVVVPDTTPPVLEVTSPLDNAHVETKVVTFAGITEPGATVTASGKFDAFVDADGRWEIDLVVSAGANGVVFSAKDEAGNESTVRMTVHHDAAEEPGGEEPKEPTTTTTKAVWEFWATQRFGNCSEPVPYDVFSGQAKPGSMVTISSEFGGGTVEAGPEGAWSLKVHFPEAPYNVPFVVKVKDAFGSKKTFEFVSYYDG